MKKLKLDLDEIKVESFETKPIQSKLGTVVGQISGDGCYETYVCATRICGTYLYVPTCGDVDECLI